LSKLGEFRCDAVSEVFVKVCCLLFRQEETGSLPDFLESECILLISIGGLRLAAFSALL
jgi:hypothetical protein